jgi:sulfur transfer protein SufE
MQWEKEAALEMILSLHKQVANLTEQLMENANKMEGIESMNTDLFIKERNNNEELRHVRKELLDVSYHVD